MTNDLPEPFQKRVFLQEIPYSKKSHCMEFPPARAGYRLGLIFFIGDLWQSLQTSLQATCVWAPSRNSFPSPTPNDQMAGCWLTRERSEYLTPKYSPIHGQSRAKMRKTSLEKLPIFGPKLMTCTCNVASFGKRPKARLQEGVLDFPGKSFRPPNLSLAPTNVHSKIARKGTDYRWKCAR